MAYKIGTIVTMTKDAVDNYGAEWENVELVVDSVATKYMPAKEFFAKGMPNGYHPGYDETANGKPLYDLTIKDTGENLNFSLYYWEVELVQLYYIN